MRGRQRSRTRLRAQVALELMTILTIWIVAIGVLSSLFMRQRSERRHEVYRQRAFDEAERVAQYINTYAPLRVGNFTVPCDANYYTYEVIAENDIENRTLGSWVWVNYTTGMLYYTNYSGWAPVYFNPGDLRNATKMFNITCAHQTMRMAFCFNANSTLCAPPTNATANQTGSGTGGVGP